MKKKLLLCGITLCLILISVITITTYNKQEYKELSQTKEKVHSNNIAMYLVNEDGAETEIDEFPSSDTHYFSPSKSYCENGSELSWNKETGEIKVSTNKSDNCMLYFIEGETFFLKDDILENYGGKTSITEWTDFSVVTAESEFGLYKAADDYGDSYYFRGDVPNNYVKFGKDSNGNALYWRIVRINGDDTIRLIYDGTVLVENGTVHTASIGSVAYNEVSQGAKYAGYVYDETNDSSTIKKYIDEWYKNNLETNYSEYLADTLFCNDREIRESETYQYYGPYVRILNENSPSLMCSRDEDKLTISSGKLSKPIGLITVDEVVMAGGTNYTGNYSYYLFDGSNHWTISPDYYANGNSHMFYVLNTGSISSYGVVNSTYNVRPVINIKKDALFTGSGTIEDPYELAL